MKCTKTLDGFEERWNIWDHVSSHPLSIHQRSTCLVAFWCFGSNSNHCLQIIYEIYNGILKETLGWWRLKVLLASPCNKGFVLHICTSAFTSLTLGLVLTASENTAIRFVPKHQRTLSEPYVLLASLSDVWYLGRITVRAAPSVGRMEAMRGKSPQWQHRVSKGKMWEKGKEPPWLRVGYQTGLFGQLVHTSSSQTYWTYRSCLYCDFFTASHSLFLCSRQTQAVL